MWKKYLTFQNVNSRKPFCIQWQIIMYQSFLVLNQRKNNTFYDMIIMNLVEKLWNVLDGHFKENYILFTIPSYKILHFSSLIIEYFFAVSWMLIYSCFLYTTAVCTLYFVFFMDIFLCSCLGFPIHSSHSLNGSMREQTAVYYKRWYQNQKSDPKGYTGQWNIWRIHSVMHKYWERQFYIMWASKCHFSVSGNSEDFNPELVFWKLTGLLIVFQDRINNFW